MSWKDYQEVARGRGNMAAEFFVVESMPVEGQDPKAHLAEHLAYQGEREKDGSLFLAGPLSDEAGENMTGGGMIIYRAENIAAARALADGDPMHQAGARSYTIRAWLVNEGSVQVTIGLSQSTATKLT